MRSDHPYTIPIWWFIGVLLAIYGVLILGAGLYELVVPSTKPTVLYDLHAPIWWGAILLVTGLIYVRQFPLVRNQ